jgi:AbrB family looped-hinge helix DNA binding protein
MARQYITTVKVMQSGRITIPADIRELEDIEQGDYVQITIEKIGESVSNNRHKSKLRRRQPQEQLSGGSNG